MKNLDMDILTHLRTARDRDVSIHSLPREIFPETQTDTHGSILEDDLLTVGMEPHFRTNDEKAEQPSVSSQTSLPDDIEIALPSASESSASQKPPTWHQTQKATEKHKHQTEIMIGEDRVKYKVKVIIPVIQNKDKESKPAPLTAASEKHDRSFSVTMDSSSETDDISQKTIVYGPLSLDMLPTICLFKLSSF